MKTKEKMFCECGKVCYTKREAQAVLNTARKPKNRFTHHGVKVHVTRAWNLKRPERIYECPFCNYWHITSTIKDSERRNKYDD